MNIKLPAYISFTLLVVVLSFVGGSWWNRPHPAEAPPGQQARKVLYYACPMHPQYHSDHNGECPSCGMRLEPVYTEGAVPVAQGSGDPSMPAGVVQVSHERQQAMGVRLGKAETASGSRALRTTGRVVARENATFQVVAGASGWIRSVGAATVGTQVRKDEVLAQFYSPELVTTEQSYFALLDSADRVNPAAPGINANLASNIQRAADALRNMGVSDRQLEEMKQKRDITQDIYLVSPVSGFVLQRNVSPGLRFDRGAEFYQITDMSKVWIMTDVYEAQADYIKAGSVARVTLPQRSRDFEARVSNIQPLFDEATRTLKLRLETDNPTFALKPGMFVDVEFAIDLPASLAVPADAIVDTGLRKTLFVDRGNGFFEARQIETGWRIGDQVEVTKGLMPGEQIVISGTFLIDSESRMKTAAQRMSGPAAKDPVCGMELDAAHMADAAMKSQFKGTTYTFCSDDCKNKFEKEPTKYAAK